MIINWNKSDCLSFLYSGAKDATEIEHKLSIICCLINIFFEYVTSYQLVMICLNIFLVFSVTSGNEENECSLH